MDKPTVQDIFHRFYPMYLDRYTPSPMQAKVARCIIPFLQPLTNLQRTPIISVQRLDIFVYYIPGDLK